MAQLIKAKKNSITATAEGLSLRSLALSPGNIISIKNSTERPLTFFLADMEDAFQDLGKGDPGQTKSFTIKIQGSL